MIEQLFSLPPIWQLYVAISLVTAVGLIPFSKRIGAPKDLAVLHSFVSLWTGAVALNHAFKWISTDLTIYADWLVTTPIILLTLVLTPTGGRVEDLDRTVLVVGSQIAVIAAGLTASVSGNFLFWGTIGVALFLNTFYLATRISSDSEYLALVFGVFVLWSFYPVIWFLDNVAGGVLTASQVTLGYFLLPVLSKHLYGFVDLYLASKR